MAKVILKFNEAVLEEIPLTKPITTIGRLTQNDITIENMAVSGQHARIIKEGEQYIIEDLNSLNGTFVNEKKVMKCPLNNNDQILIGKHILIFVDEIPQVIEKTIVLDTKKQRELLAKAAAMAKGDSKKVVKEKEAFLTIISGSVRGKKEINLVKKLTVIGKDEEADVKVKGFFLPKTCCFIKKKEDKYIISPSPGKHVTKVNGKTLTKPTELNDGDMIEVGSTKMHFFFKE
ncbi:MAG: hypothetical protein DRG20_04085 [Deltaproteobacteria bacterium]|nr:MAG: hypothetical protein DRG20_04085 [Deltaproteobacteria bacterium]